MNKKIKKLFTKKRIIWSSISLILLVIIIGSFVANVSKKNGQVNLFEVEATDLEQTVSETGTVKKSNEIALSFKAGGIIDDIYVEVGDKVKKGKLLAKTDYADLNAQYQKADASFKSAQAQLNKLLAGATAEEISLAETQVNNAKINLENKQTSLENTRLSAENDLDEAYQDALSSLNNAYLDLQGSYLALDDVYQSYFNSNNIEGITVKNARDITKEKRDRSKTYIDIALASETEEDIDSALIVLKSSLDTVYDGLSDARDVCDTVLYRTTVSDTDKTSLDAQKSNINTERTNIISAKQTIASTKITNQTSIDTAEALVRQYEGALAEANKSLAKLIAGPTQEEIDVYQASVSQAQADKSLLASQINQARLVSPVDAQVVRVEREVGETAIAGETIISLLSEKPYQVETDIYEEDIAKLNLGDAVRIELIAFPELDISGTVASIDPIDKVVDGVVYYEVAIDFDDEIEKLKPGMSADVVIQTDLRSNVIVVPTSAILKENGKTYVNVLEGDQKIKKEVKLGLDGDDGLIEILKGVALGDQVILP